jgi:hypothetical protein
MNSLTPLLTVSVIDGFCNCALAAFIAVRVVTKSAMVCCRETKCSPASPPSAVSKSRRRMTGLPSRRARAHVCAWPITP